MSIPLCTANKEEAFFKAWNKFLRCDKYPQHIILGDEHMSIPLRTANKEAAFLKDWNKFLRDK
jgi:hypothetical protein